MKITVPPVTSNIEGNLIKQRQVFDLCYHPEWDDLVLYPMDCPILDEIHTESHMDRARRHFSGFSAVDPRHIMHAEASASAMIAAARAAITAPQLARVAFAPVSGFHHAGPDRMGGFCTFNGLVATARAMKDEMRIDTCLILDGDGHFGDGTNDFLLMPEYTGWLRDWHIGGTPSDGSEAQATNPPWSFWLERLSDVLSQGAVDLILYQAGADAHRDDPYGVGHLSTGQFMARDQTIFRLAADHGVPIVWNLAGGYNGTQTLDLHTSTYESACAVYEPNRRRDVRRAATVFPDDTSTATR